MSTLALRNSQFSSALSDDKAGLSLFHRLQLRREALARTHIRGYFANLSDQRLADLGFDADDVAAVRRGEYRLPRTLRTGGI